MTTRLTVQRDRQARIQRSRKTRVWLLPALMVLLQPVFAYEISTHALITDHAWRASTLNPDAPDSIVPVLGFDRLDEIQPFAFLGEPGSTLYFDDAAVLEPADNLPPWPSGSSTLRRVQEQERRVLDALVQANYFPGQSGAAIEQRIHAWLMRGSIREDDNDYKLFGFWTDGDARDPDPYGHLFRAFRHFYDPFYDRASEYHPLCTEYGCLRSIHWALGRTDPLHPESDADNVTRRNHFTWQDARNNYWWALTLQRDAIGVDSADARISSQERMHRWATTIKSLGHTIHLLQDTAQPQHVRNDLHGPPITSLRYSDEGEADAAFEAFTDYRVLGSRAEALAVTFGGGNPLRRMYDDTLPSENNLPRIRLGAPNYYPGGGARVQFSTPVKFFTTRHVETGTSDTSLRSRRGLADLANRSFFTSGTLPGFRECQPPGTSGCVPTEDPTYPLPESDLTDPDYTEVSVPSGLRVHGRVVHLAEYAYPVTDAVAPNYDQSLGTLAAYGGKAPLVTKGMWYDITPHDFDVDIRTRVGHLITYNNMRYAADVMVPRAVGYSAGMIDFFFRGRLEVLPIQQSIFAVLNQGDPHFIDADGYPRHTNDPSKVFGFESVRLQVRNATADIVESGTGTIVPQATGGAASRLVAIARYHRNACYQPDLAGERVQDFGGAITEPTCASTLPVRTAYQEISVSAPLVPAAGELDGASPVELQFDFSADPIPVNATDLFIQVAYRGRLGEEADGIAVGTYDVSEPTFAAAWNNTDYFWNGTDWIAQNSSNPRRAVNSYWACGGVPSRFIYRYAGTPGAVAMAMPPDPGSVRLALLFGKPANPNQRFAVRSVPIMLSAPHAQMRSGFTRGQIRQANKEVISAATLATPQAGCFLAPPSASEYWCFDPVQRRRGIAFGEIAQPLYYSFVDGTDVDSIPLPAWTTTTVRGGGEIRFNNPGALQSCPMQPTATPEEQELQDWLEELELYGES